jgi:hypothetical protein
MRRRSVRPLLRAAALTVTTGAFSVLALTAGRAGAEPTVYAGQFAGVAAADGIRVTVDVPNSVSRNPVDGGGPTAQANLDSLGTSIAFASHPYPGSIPVGGPSAVTGVLAGLFPQLGQLPTPPGYPFYVESRYPLSGRSEATGPGQSLEAESTATSASSRAAGGFGTPSGSAGFLRSASSVASTSERVAAAADSTAEGFAVGPLSIGRVVSTAAVTLTSDGRLERTGDIAIGGVSVAGVPVAISANGVSLAGGSIPLPSAEAVTKALEQANISVGISPKEDSRNGVVAPAVRIVQQFPGNGGSVTYLIGVASAAIQGPAVETGGAGGLTDGCVGSCSGPSESGTVPTGLSGDGGPAAPSDGTTDVAATSGWPTNPSLTIGSASDSVTAPQTVAGGAGAVRPASPEIGSSRRAQLAMRGVQTPFDASATYLAVGAAALLGLGLSQLHRFLVKEG